MAMADRPFRPRPIGLTRRERSTHEDGLRGADVGKVNGVTHRVMVERAARHELIGADR
jgi:hypothetical protein